MNWETMLCLGDSITIGSRSYLGYPEHCGDMLRKKTRKSWNVINRAVAGYTTIDLVRDVDRHFSHLQAFRPQVITVLIGTNDLKSPTAPEDFRIAYELLITKARLIAGNSHLLLIEIPPLADGVMLPYTMSMNATAAAFNTIIRETAEKEKLTMHAFRQEPEQFYDGVHLNDAGARSWGAQLAECILQLRTQ